MVACPNMRADSTDYEALTASLKAQTEYLNAQAALIKAQDSVEQQKSSAEEAKKAKKDEDRLAIIEAASGIVEKLPTGKLSVSGNGVASPRSTALAFDNLELATADILTKITGEVGGQIIIFSDSTTIPISGNEHVVYDGVIRDLGKEAKSLGLSYVEPQSALLAAAAIPVALDFLLKVTAVDTTESVFDGKLTDSSAAAVLAGKLIPIAGHYGKHIFATSPESRKEDGRSHRNDTNSTALPPTAPQEPDVRPSDSQDGQEGLAEDQAPLASPVIESPVAAVFASREAFAAHLFDPKNSVFINKLVKLTEIDEEISKLLDTAPSPREEKEVATLTTEADDMKTALDEVERKRDLLSDLTKLSESSAALYLAGFEQASDEYLRRESALRSKKAELARAKQALTKATETVTRLKKLQENIRKLIATFRSTDGSPPLIVRVIRDEQLWAAQNKGNLRIITLKVVASPQSLISRKSALSEKHTHSSLVALQYSVSDASSRLKASGVVSYYVEAREQDAEVNRSRARK